MDKRDNLPYTHCLNCGAELQGQFCHECGQEAINPNPSVKELIMIYLDNAWMWDPTAIRSIWVLISRPGHLTNLFTEGKLVGYLHPLRLNMFLMFVFITVFFLFSSPDNIYNSVRNVTTDSRYYPELQIKLAMSEQPFVEKLTTSPKDTVELLAPLSLAATFPEYITNINTIEDTNGESLDRWIAVLPRSLIDDQMVIRSEGENYYHFNSEHKLHNDKMKIFYVIWEQLQSITTGYFPIIILLTTPILSFSLRRVHRKVKRPKVQFFIFALHYIAMLELVMLFIYLLHLIAAPPAKLLEWILLTTSCIYLTIAFRTVYNIRSWIKSFIKAVLTSAIYTMICSTIFFGIFITSIIIAIVRSGIV